MRKSLIFLMAMCVLFARETEARVAGSEAEDSGRVSDAQRREEAVIDFFEEKRSSGSIPTTQEVRDVYLRSGIVFSDGAYEIGGCSVTLCSISREERVTTLGFAISKTKESSVPEMPIEVIVRDDHDNTYRGQLKIPPFLGLRTGLLPMGFTYVKAVELKMPKLAPLHRVKLGSTEEVDFNTLRLIEPTFPSEFGAVTVKPGTETKVARFVSLTVDGIVPDLYTWALSFTLENKDYNSFESSVWCAVQLADGTILSENPCLLAQVDGLSRRTFCKPLDALEGKAGPDIRMIILLWQRAPSQEALRLWPISAKDIPPRVGQGGENKGEKLFVEAYTRNGGREQLGDPLGPVRWLSGCPRARDDRDLLIQQVGAQSDGLKGAIVWDVQQGIDRAYVLQGATFARLLDPGSQLTLLFVHSHAPLLVPLGTSNVALHKSVTSSGYNLTPQELGRITDGDKEARERHTAGLHLAWPATIDLEGVYEVYAVALWHMYGWPHFSYVDVVVEISETADFSMDATEIFNSDIDNPTGPESVRHRLRHQTLAPELIEARGIPGRYVRLYSKRAAPPTVGPDLLEVEIYGRPATRLARPRSDTVKLGGLSDEGSQLVPLDIELPKSMFPVVAQDSHMPNLEKPSGRPRGPLLVPVGTQLVSLNKPVSASDEDPITGHLEMLTDGNKEATDGSYVELGPLLQHVTVDLGVKHEVSGICVWHYHRRPRIYLDVVVQIANDQDFSTDVVTVFNNDVDNTLGRGIGNDMLYAETFEGKLIDCLSQGSPKGRYIRLYSNGNTANDLNHYIEVEVYGIPVKEPRTSAH